MTTTDIREAAFEYAEMCEYEHKFNKETKCAGRKWLRGFMKSNPNLSIKTPEALSLPRAQGLNREAVTDFYNLLHATLEENGLMDKPENIHNVDESGLPLNMRPSKVISERGNRDCVAIKNKERGENVTVVACFSASGSYIPPFVISKGARRKPEFGDGFTPGSSFTMTEWLHK